ncbi:carboxylate-amine ligase [Rhizorhapis suberifaciens]|uniref:Carboxylate-amine ligase n=1 Tax=Rhizorhapis suberifaciens TaxID=13656 RepID=A0A840HXK2_9SPHN|nr:YbdK family carboxylate-amine ligase [Rhizorhapis suberifaciens]MBB4642723.1 carboxylate-amine ligase [Rhizorhapis suberifaciens]
MSEAFTYGVEEEFLLLSRSRLSVSSRNRDDIVSAINKDIGGSRCSKEFYAYQIETITDPCSDRMTLLSQLKVNREALLEVSARFDEIPLATGLLPERMSGWDEITDSAKYGSIIDRHPEYTMFGGGGMSALHVHVAVPADIDRIRILNSILPMVPVFIALAANSPIFDGSVGAFLSMRRAVLSAIPRFGFNPPFRRYEEYELWQSRYLKSGIIARPGELWWMVRPSQSYPTIELRAPDTCRSPLLAAALAALFRCLVIAGCRSDGASEPMASELSVLEESCRQAARYGVRARLPDPMAIPLELATLVRNCLSQLQPIAAEFGHDDDFGFIAHAVTGNEAALRTIEAWELYQDGLTEAGRKKFFDTLTVTADTQWSVYDDGRRRRPAENIPTAETK